MQIIKNKQIIQDEWHYVADNSTIMPGNITVSEARWQQDKATLLDHPGKLGLRIRTDQPIETIADDLKHFALVELNFPTFTDGRGFSQAWLLRNRYHYTGEIRAVGDFMRDQLFYLHRVGVDSFQLNNAQNLQDALASLNDFSVHYQTSTR